jgi:GTP-binding protein
VRIHYLTQGGIRPPTFLVWANRPAGLSQTYRRFLVNQFRARYGFGGTPIRIVAKAKRSGREDRGGRGKRGGRGGRGGGSRGGRRRSGKRRSGRR